MAKDVGINLAVQSLEVATFQEYQSSGNYDPYMGSFTMVNGDSFTEITNLIGKDRFNTGYKNQELTDLRSRSPHGRPGRARLTDAGRLPDRHGQLAPTVYLYEP